VKRLCADDSAATSVKVGHRQALTQKTPFQNTWSGVFAFELRAFCSLASLLQNRHPLPFFSTDVFLSAADCEMTARIDTGGGISAGKI
jgi:hypothetical protein